MFFESRVGRGAVGNGTARMIWTGGLILMLAGCGGGGGGSSSDDGGRNEPPPPPVQRDPVTAVATEAGSPLDTAVTQAIGPAGGVLESADGTLRVEVPAGALIAEQTFSIQSISNNAHGKIGSAFRLGPEGVTFASPIRLTFNYTPDQVLGTAPQLLRVASQNRNGFWELHNAQQLDADEGTVSVNTTHFSDWSLVAGAQLSPESATVKPGETVALSVVVCAPVQTDDLLTTLLSECQPSTVIRNLVRNWSVNGVSGGDGHVGTVAVQDDRLAVYTAPASAPQSNPVAVSTEYTTLQGELVTLISNIRIQTGLCTPANPGEPCFFDLVQYNGRGLPSEELPREIWENPERITGGRLSLRDYDGNGEGTWALRHVWVEERTSGNLEQFVQAAGDFTSDASGRLNFTALGGEAAFTGSIQQGTVTIEGFPLSTQNVTVSAQLTFQQP